MEETQEVGYSHSYEGPGKGRLKRATGMELVPVLSPEKGAGLSQVVLVTSVSGRNKELEGPREKTERSGNQRSGCVIHRLLRNSTRGLEIVSGPGK